MEKLTLVLGNKNYSSWSVRPYLALWHAGIPFEEKVIVLDRPQTASEISRFSPSGRVPVLIQGDLRIWDSLAICEYANELAPSAHLWPEDPLARAVARSASAEMHSGFQALREAMPVNIRASIPTEQVSPEVRRDIDRVLASWTQLRASYGKGGPFLFGAFSIADAMYAPVVTRFRTYGVRLEGAPAAYAEAALAHPAMRDWLAAAEAEPEAISKYEKKK